MKKVYFVTLLTVALVLAMSGCQTGRQCLNDSEIVQAIDPQAVPVEAPVVPEPVIVPLDQMPQGVIATVGDEKITRAELDSEMKRASRGEHTGALVPAGQQKKALGNLIDCRIITMMAKKAGVAANSRKVEDILAKQKAYFPTEEEFKKRLSAIGLTEDDLRNKITEGIMQQRYLETLTKDFTFSDDEMKAKYEELGLEELKAKGWLKSNETADVAHILVEEDGTDEARKKIYTAYARLLKGEAFATVAEEVSEDPASKEYKAAKSDQMAPEFELRIFGPPKDLLLWDVNGRSYTTELRIGEVSEPFYAQGGWHILKINKRTEAGDIATEAGDMAFDFDDIKDDLKKFMLDQKKRELLEGLIVKTKQETPVKMVELPEAP